MAARASGTLCARGNRIGRHAETPDAWSPDIVVVSLIAAAGGCGRSTLAAGLADALHRRGRSVLAVDLDPANALALHLGASAAPNAGIAHCEGDWTATALSNSDGVRAVPFGAPALPALLRFERHLAEHPGWLREQLGRVALAADTIVLVDTPRLPSVLAVHAAAASDHVLAVLSAEPMAYATLDRLEHLQPGHTHFVVNAFEPQRPLQQDVLLLLRERLGARLWRELLHRDAGIAEAQARNRALPADAPYSQAAEDLQQLCARLLRLVDGNPA